MTGARHRHDATVGAACVLAAATAIQSSAAIGFPAFSVIGAAATSGFRFLLGAAVLLVVARPSVRGFDRAAWLGVLAFGVAVAVMNLCFFQAVARLPLGTAVSIEFLGPFTLAVVAGSGRRHSAYAVLGLVGVVLLARPGGGITVEGALFALGAAAGWASYTLASEHLGSLTKGVDGLALALVRRRGAHVPVHRARLRVDHLVAARPPRDDGRPRRRRRLRARARRAATDGCGRTWPCS